MALKYWGTCHDGTPIYIDEEKMKEEIESGEADKRLLDVCCLRTLLPVNEKTREYEDEDEPGMVDAYCLENGLYHPMGKDGWPDESVTLNENGEVVEA